MYAVGVLLYECKYMWMDCMEGIKRRYECDEEDGEETGNTAEPHWPPG